MQAAVLFEGSPPTPADTREAVKLLAAKLPCSGMGGSVNNEA